MFGDSNYNPVADVFATIRAKYASDAAKASANTFNGQNPSPVGVSDGTGTVYPAGKASLSQVLASSPALLVGAGVLAIGLLVYLAKH